MNLRITGRLALLSAFMILTLLLSSGAGYYGANKLAEGLDYVTHTAWDAADGTMEGMIHIQEQAIALSQLAGTTDEQRAARISEKILEAERAADEALKRMAATGLFDKGMLERLDQHRTAFNKARDEMLRSYSEYRRAPGAATSVAVVQANRGFDEATAGLLEFLTELESVGDQQVEDYIGQIETTKEGAYSAIATALIIGIIVAIAASALIVKSVVLPIQAMARQFLDLAQGEGNLTITLPEKGSDEITDVSRGFNLFVSKIRRSVQQITSSSRELNNEAGKLSRISRDTAHNLNQQQQETEQVATAMNEMVATVQEVARNVTDAARAADAANLEAANGKKIVTTSITEINALASEVRQAADVMARLEKDSENIGGVLSVIKAIADQTNLLALNAAIEAARAGEQGRGFAVVADEVRTLASRTQQSTEEIQKMIESLQSGAREAVNVMERGQRRAQSSVEQANNAGSALESITAAVATITNMTAQIASAAEEQNAVAEEVNSNIVSISNMSQESSGSAAEISTATQQLNRLAQQLDGVVSQFRT